MKAIKVMAAPPLMLIGEACGFVFMALAVGFHAGADRILSLAEECNIDLKNK